MTAAVVAADRQAPAQPLTLAPRVLRLVLGSVLALAVLLAGAGAAAAHDVLAGTEPAAGAVLASPPSQVRLQFTDPVLDGSAQLRVTGPAGVVASGPVAVSGSVVTAALPGGAAGGLPDGGYTVLWRVTSQDGHPVSGTFAFRIGAAPASPASPAPPGPAATGPAASGAAASGAALLRAVAAGTTVLLLAAAGVLAARRARSRRRSRP